MWINPKLNWKDTDFYNPMDLNRVENNTLTIAEALRGLSYNIPLETVVTNRSTSSIDFISGINRVEINIKSIKDNFLTPPGFEGTKTWALGMGFNYMDATRLEKNLDLLYNWLNIAKENLVYCGNFNCGTEWEGGLY